MFGFKKSGENGADGKSTGWRVLLIPLGALCGILLLVFGSGFGNQKKENDAPRETDSSEQVLADYRQALERDIQALCESVEGVGNVTVALTLSGGFSDVYATEAGRDGGEQYVIVGSGSNASALRLSRNAPEIVGIGIVCRGGMNSEVRRELTALLSAAYHVPTNRIYITEAKKAGTSFQPAA